MTVDPRPDPDALLRELRKSEEKERRGKLKVFLGAAAGVGKTYAMLTEAHEQIQRGVDVVAGYIEPHGRVETEALAEGIPQLPYLVIRHRDVALREFDLDKALERKPQILLVDELAHTNAPGCRHPKRWMDVEELLQSGINVYTTVNVQHVESLNDVVAQITGVQVRETVPDAMLDRANEIELVDLPPDELLQRLHEGKVYVPGQVAEAVQSFFRKGNLIALRDLALRQTAEHVEADLQTYRMEHAVRETWAAGNRILVCLAPNRLANRVVRVAKRLAGQLHAELVAVYVENPRSLRMTPQARQLALDAMELASSLGMETITLSGTDIVAEVLKVARQRNVTLIVVGKPVKPRWREYIFGSVVDELVRHSGTIDVHVITGSGDAATAAPAIYRSPGSTWRSFTTAVSTVALATVLGTFIRPHVQLSNVIMVYLLAVAVVAARSGPSEAVVASVLSVLGFSAFFVTPMAEQGPQGTEYLITFAMMMLVALLISSLALRLRVQADAARERERRTNALYELTRDLARSRSKKEIGEATAEKIRRAIDADVAILVLDENQKLAPIVVSSSEFEQQPSEHAVLMWCFTHGERAGRGTNTLPGADGLYLPLKTDRGVVGVLGVLMHAKETKLGGVESGLLDTFVSQAALAFERTILAKETQLAKLTSERERIRDSILRSVSRDLRQPLAAIDATTRRLAAQLEGAPESAQALTDEIRAETKRVDALVRNLMDMTRIESGAVELESGPYDLADIVDAAQRRVQALSGRPLQVSIEPGLPPVWVDATLIEQVLVNLLENIAVHTPPSTLVEINGTLSGPRVRVEVADRGPGIPGGEQERIFEKFHRVAESKSPGFGLGLTICRAILEAHGGKIWAENRFGGGASFVLELPTAATEGESLGAGD